MSVLSVTERQTSQRYLTAIRDTATEYAEGIFRRLREHEYDPELVRLYVVGGGSCILKNFGSYDKDRVIINDDICATVAMNCLLNRSRTEKEASYEADLHDYPALKSCG